MKRVKKRSYNHRLVCRDMSYSVQDTAEIFGVHKNTVLQWLKSGLSRIDASKPYLIHGSDLIAYLKKKKTAKKSRCEVNEFFCCRCQMPQKVFDNKVDVIFINSKKLNLRGLCSICGAKVLRLGNPEKLNEYRKIFTLQERVNRHIVESRNSSLNSD